MYNPEKQVRAAGGKFGGKIAADTKAVEQAVQTLATDVIDEGQQIVAQADAAIVDGYKTLNQRINEAKPGEIVQVPVDYITRGITNKRTGWTLLAIVAVIVVIAVLALTGCN